MKRLFAVLLVCMFVMGGISLAMAGDGGQSGPAPNSGDGIQDGSGMDSRIGPFADDAGGQGPAPNSGDGIQDGSGF